MKKNFSVVLIYPPKKHQVASQTPSFAHKEFVNYPPMGLLYLAGMFKDDPLVDIEVIDCQVKLQYIDQLMEHLGEKKPNVIGITLISNLLYSSYQILREIRKNLPDTHVLVGGPHATIYPLEILESRLVDFVFTGDAEYSFHRMITLFQEGQGHLEAELKDIPGLAWIDNTGSLQHSPNSSHQKLKLDDIPFPDRGKLDHVAYGNPANIGEQTAYILTSRGCPFRCNFCDIPHKNYLFRDHKNVVDEMEELQAFGFDEIMILDDTFNIQIDRVEEICHEILRRNLKIRWVGRGRVAPFTESLAVLLKKAGCYRFHVGVESGSDDMLKQIGKKITLTMVRDFFTICRGHNIDTLAYFIIGFPDETESQIQETIKFAQEINPEYIYFSILSLFPNTAVYTQAIDQGVVTGDTWREFAKSPTEYWKIPLWTQTISEKRLHQLLRQSYRKFYFSFGYIMRLLGKNLRSPSMILHTGKIGARMLRYVVSRSGGFD